MEEIELWAAGAFSAYGIARRRGKVPSLMIGGFTRELPTKLIEALKLGRIEAGAMPRWVCDRPDEVAAFYKRVGPHLIESRRQMIEDAWEGWRVWVVEKGQPDPGEMVDAGHAEIWDGQREAPRRAARVVEAPEPDVKWLLEGLDKETSPRPRRSLADVPDEEDEA
jgi:hypothetical protein